MPQVSVLPELVPARNEPQLAGLVQPLQDRVNRGEVVHVLRQIEADRFEPLAHVGWSDRHARAADDEAAGVGEPDRHSRHQAAETRKRANRLRHFGEPLVDVLPLLAERLVLANGRLERAPIVVCRHRMLRSPQRAVAHSAATRTAEFAGVLVRRRACRRGWVLFARLRERPVRRASFPHTYTSCVNPCQHVSRVVAMCLLAS